MSCSIVGESSDSRSPSQLREFGAFGPLLPEEVSFLCADAELRRFGVRMSSDARSFRMPLLVGPCVAREVRFCVAAPTGETLAAALAGGASEEPLEQLRQHVASLSGPWCKLVVCLRASRQVRFMPRADVLGISSFDVEFDWQLTRAVVKGDHRLISGPKMDQPTSVVAPPITNASDSSVPSSRRCRRGRWP